MDWGEGRGLVIIKSKRYGCLEIKITRFMGKTYLFVVEFVFCMRKRRKKDGCIPDAFIFRRMHRTRL